MKILISPVSVDEAMAAATGADIIDVKNTREGSLGASFPWIIREIVAATRREGLTFSATLGDLPYKPGTAALAALGAAASGARYVKAGLHGAKHYNEALEMMRGIVRACRDYDPDIIVVAAGYADYRRIDGLDPESLIKAARDAGADLVMVDTAIKDGRRLFDVMTEQEIRTFVDGAHACGLQVALAGSIRIEDLPRLGALQPDVIGVRGGVCRANDRSSTIDPSLVAEFVHSARLATV